LRSVWCASGASAVEFPQQNAQQVEAGTRIAWNEKVKSYQQEQGVTAVQRSVQRPRSQGLGQLVVQDSQSGSPVRLNIARYHANVVLEPPVALVQIDQSFYNP